jgi:hypothetical protein
MDERQRTRRDILLKIWAFVGPGIGVIVGWCFTYRQTVVSEKTYDRASGQIVAKLKMVGIRPNDRDIPSAYRTKGDLFHNEVHFNDLDQILAVNPTIVVENNGSEPIDALRVEVQETDGMIDGRDLPAELATAKTPWVTRQSEVAEYPLNEKLTRGMKASVTIVPGLIGQMSQSQAKDGRNTRDHFGRFKVTVFGRIVGGTTYDRTDVEMGVQFVWMPKGFPEDKCKNIVETMKPRVEVFARE